MYVCHNLDWLAQSSWIRVAPKLRQIEKVNHYHQSIDDDDDNDIDTLYVQCKCTRQLRHCHLFEIATWACDLFGSWYGVDLFACQVFGVSHPVDDQIYNSNDAVMIGDRVSDFPAVTDKWF